MGKKLFIKSVASPLVVTSTPIIFTLSPPPTITNYNTEPYNYYTSASGKITITSNQKIISTANDFNIYFTDFPNTLNTNEWIAIPITDGINFTFDFSTLHTLRPLLMSGIYYFEHPNGASSDPFDYYIRSPLLLSLSLPPPTNGYTTEEITITSSERLTGPIYFTDFPNTADTTKYISINSIDGGYNFKFNFTNVYYNRPSAQKGRYYFEHPSLVESRSFTYTPTAPPVVPIEPGTYTSFHLSPSLDEYYMNATTGGSYITHTITNYYCMIAYGSNDKTHPATSEALSYCLNFYSELYMISKINNNTNKYNTCVDNIIYILNTILTLYTNNQNWAIVNGQSQSSFYNNIFPAWSYYDNGSTLAPQDNNYYYFSYSATDSNIEILKSLLKLYIFNEKDTDKHLSTITHPNLINTSLYNGVNIQKTDKINITLKKIIVTMINNIMYGTNTIPGSFISFNPNNITSNGLPSYSFYLTSNGINDAIGFYGTGSIIDTYFSDYINFSCYIYLYKFFQVIGINADHPENSSIFNILGEGTSNKLSSWQYTNYALSNYLNYIDKNIQNGNFNNANLLGDNMFATINRLSYQLVHLYILLNKGDTRLGITNGAAIWTSIITAPYNTINKIASMCNNLINFEINKNMLYFEKTVDDNKNITFQKPYAIDDSNYGSTHSNPAEIYRQLTYMCFKKLMGANYSPITKRNNYGDTTFFEATNVYFGYFGFDDTGIKLDNALQSILTSYNHTQTNNFNITGLGDSYDSGGDWKQNGQKWYDSNSDKGNQCYFNFSICALHQMIYYLYLGV